MFGLRQALFRDIRSHTKYEESFGLKHKPSPNVHWLGALPSSSQALFAFLQSTIFGVKNDGHLKTVMKSGKTAAEICAAPPLSEDIEQWKSMVAEEARWHPHTCMLFTCFRIAMSCLGVHLTCNKLTAR